MLKFVSLVTSSSVAEFILKHLNFSSFWLRSKAHNGLMLFILPVWRRKLFCTDWILGSFYIIGHCFSLFYRNAMDAKFKNCTLENFKNCFYQGLAGNLICWHLEEEINILAWWKVLQYEAKQALVFEVSILRICPNILIFYDFSCLSVHFLSLSQCNITVLYLNQLVFV